MYILGKVPITLQFRPEGSSKKFTPGRFDQTIWKSQEWCKWHKESQVVCNYRLDCHLSEKGETLPDQTIMNL